MGQLETIMLVCRGNTCRSVMAEVMLKRELEKVMGDAAKDIRVISAGVSARCGDPASCQAEEAMKELGLDVSLHRARRVSAEALNDADIVLAMTESLKDELLQDYPIIGTKVMTLTEFAGLTRELGQDIKDPFGYPLDVYKASAAQIGRAVEIVARKIKDSFESRRDNHEDRNRE
ncbi:MAG TPA: low molecular weight protein arginine phosphatase [Bacillota bacterium]|nr:low molecular weight protein arginine phosphatase [Bacillota bacterium]